MTKTSRYSRETTLDPWKYEFLLWGIKKVDCDFFRFESRFSVFLGGRRGLSWSDITHIHENWQNWQNYCIDISLRDSCNQSRDKGLCGLYCQSVCQRVECHDLMLSEGRTQTVNPGQLPANLPESIVLLTIKGEHVSQGVDS